MDILRLSLICGVIAAFAPFARGTGDFYEEAVPPLAEELHFDRLPARSMSEIISESRGPAPAPVEIN
ncbi:MAG: hypothetical protein ABI680_11505, partial [Chthoniobacteraceae bacterium]